MFTLKRNLQSIGVMFLVGGLLAGCESTSSKGSMGGGMKNRPLAAGEVKALRLCMKDCTQMCQKNMNNADALGKSLKRADQALNSGDNSQAKAEMATAMDMLATTQSSMKAMMDKMPCANACCPMSGKPLDMSKPIKKTRMHKGVKVGFGDKADLSQWDRLSDAEKEEKIKAVVPDYMTTNMFTYIQ